MVLRTRPLSKTLFSIFFLIHLGACSSLDLATEETVQSSEDQASAEAGSDVPTTEIDKAIAEASRSDFTEPTDVQLSGDMPVDTEKATAVPDTTAVDAVDTSMPTPVVPDFTSESAAAISSSVSIYFAKSSSRVTREYHAQLIELAGKLKQDRSIRVNLSGHCDNRGSAAFNRRLANKRAKAVKSVLMKMGVKSRQMHIAAPQLAQSGGSEQQHAQNRRVEVEFQ